MADVRHRLISEGELHNPKGFTSAGNYTEAIRDENGVARYKKSKFLEDALNFVDGNAAPPTEVLGAIYVLIDEGTGAVNAGWDGVNYNEWCRFNGVEWVGFAPTEGVICYDATANFHKIFNGTSWLRLIPIAENISDANLTWAGDTTQYLNGNNLTFTDGILIKKGGDNLAASSNFKLQNSSGTDLFDFRNNGDLIQNANTSPIIDGTLFNDSFSFHVDSGSLKGRYKDNLGVVADLNIGEIPFGLIEVIRDSDNGEPTYFSDLQSALETCKASGSNNVVKLHSNVNLTSSININNGGTGVGNDFNYDSLTIDFNGFKIIFDDAGSNSAFIVSFLNSTLSKQKIAFLDGEVRRINGTGTHYALHFPSTGRGDIIMSQMIWHCDNGGAARVGIIVPSSNQTTHNLGGSLFSSSSSLDTLYIGNSSFSNFEAKNSSSGNGLKDNGSKIVKNFISTSESGIGYYCRADSASEFYCYSNSNYGLELDNDSKVKNCYNFSAESNSNIAIAAASNFDTLSHFNAYSNSGNYAVYFVNGVFAEHGKILSNSGYGGFLTSSRIKNCNFTSISGLAAALFRDDNIIKHCTFDGQGGYGVKLIDFSNNNNSVFKHCDFESSYNNAAGHSVLLDIGTATAYFKNCSFDVANTSANCLSSASAATVNVVNSSLGGLVSPTTPIHANVTITASTDEGNGNRSL